MLFVKKIDHFWMLNPKIFGRLRRPMSRPPHDAHFYRVSGPIFFNFRWFQSHFRSFQPARTRQYTHWRACGAKKNNDFLWGFFIFFIWTKSTNVPDLGSTNFPDFQGSPAYLLKSIDLVLCSAVWKKALYPPYFPKHFRLPSAAGNLHN